MVFDELNFIFFLSLWEYGSFNGIFCFYINIFFMYDNGVILFYEVLVWYVEYLGLFSL